MYFSQWTQTAELKARQDIVDASLQQLQVTQAGQQVEMLKAFLPVSFARHEAMGVETVLAAERIPVKSEVLMQFVNGQVL